MPPLFITETHRPFAGFGSMDTSMTKKQTDLFYLSKTIDYCHHNNTSQKIGIKIQIQLLTNQA